MNEPVFVARTDELNHLLGLRPFIALPQEEIERLYAGIELFAIDHPAAETDPSVTQLVAFTVVHYNYSWFTCRYFDRHQEAGAENMRSIGLTNHISPFGGSALFLDERLGTAAKNGVEEHLLLNGGYDLRLSGLLSDNSIQSDRQHLYIVYVARLRQPGVHAANSIVRDIRFYGTGTLQEESTRFNTTSRILIGHLVAL